MCGEVCAEFIPEAANDHEANGSVERANQTLRNFFRRVRAGDQKAPVEDILSQATYAENICAGTEAASSFKLLYGRKPRILDKNPHGSRRRRRRTRQKGRQSRLEWHAALERPIFDHVVTPVHGQVTKTSSLNRIQKRTHRSRISCSTTTMIFNIATAIRLYRVHQGIF